NGRRTELPAELRPPGEAVEVVEQADDRRDGGTDEDPPVDAVEREKCDRWNEYRQEDGEPAEAGNRAPVDLPVLVGPVDDAEYACDPADRGSEHEHHHQGHEEAP